MNPERLAKAQAPWATWEPDTDQVVQIVKAFKDKGALAGKVAVFADTGDSAAMKNQVLPALKDLGITPVASAVMDAPVGDTAAIQSKVNLIAQNFQSRGADTVLIVGIEGTNWMTYMKSNPYRPKLLFTDTTAPLSFVSNASTTDADLALLDGALEGGVYGPDQAVYDEPGMQACIKTLTAAGVKVPSPALSKPGDASDLPYQAAFRTCPAMTLTKALLEKAGRNLNYGTLAAAMNGLKVKIPGDPTERTYGPPPAADGNPAPYIFAWDAAKKKFVLDQG